MVWLGVCAVCSQWSTYGASGVCDLIHQNETYDHNTVYYVGSTFFFAFISALTTFFFLWYSLCFGILSLYNHYCTLPEKSISL